MKKDKRIQAELERLEPLFMAISPNRRSLVDGLIRRAAYMKVTLEDYEDDIDDNGYVEKFSQSERLDPYERTRPVAQLYNTMNKNYQSIIKQLVDLLPDDIQKTAEEEIKEWL